jgi:cation-transporting P-type ATPase G
VPEARASAISGLLLGGGALASWLDYEGAALVGFAAALVVGGWTFIPRSVRASFRGTFGVGTLMTIGALGAVALGEVAEAATLAFLFSISEALESYSLDRTRRGLRDLLDLVPPSPTVLRDGGTVTVAAEELVVGDVMVVRPGEKIATDGRVKEGRSAVDASAITGESVPIEVGPDDEVYAASLNGSGALEVEVTATAEDNSLARVVDIVERAQERKATDQRMAERIAAPLVPSVMVLGALIAAAGSLLGSPGVWIERALVVLVAAAPCAFALSVPISVVAAIGAATRTGVLIKGGAALEALAGIRALAFDKTGTMTRNLPQVIEVVSANGHAQDDVLSVAAALEAHSEHPLAQAILDKVGSTQEAREVKAVPGSGLSGMLDGHPVRLGRPGFIATAGLAGDVERLQDQGSSVVLVERGDELLGAVAVRDELRDEVPDVVAALKRNPLKLNRVVMLTGDNRRTARALARDAGVEAVEAELLPEDKARAIERLEQESPVAMVGDGVNDAPALATARVGIAMGAMGSDVAIETADVALMGEDLRRVPECLVHARRSVTIMRQNLLLSGAIIALLMPLAAFGALGLAAVVAIHEVAEVAVIANGLRAGRRFGLAANASG